MLFSPPNLLEFRHSPEIGKSTARGNECNERVALGAPVKETMLPVSRPDKENLVPAPAGISPTAAAYQKHNNKND
jgi:hypothetical protein